MLAFKSTQEFTDQPSFMPNLLRKRNTDQTSRARKRGLVGVLLAAVLGFSLILVPHVYDLALHQSGDYCVTCDLLHASGHGVAPTVLDHFLPTIECWTKFFYTSPAPFAHHVYRARAPPGFSRV